MNKSPTFPATVLSSLLFAFVPVLNAAAPSGHAHHGHHAAPAPDSSVAATPLGLHESVDSLHQHLVGLEAALTARNVKDIHRHDEQIKSLAKGLDKDTTITGDKKRRVHGHAEKIAWLSAKIHAQAHEDKFAQAGKDFAKLKAEVGRLEKQLPDSRQPAPGVKADTTGTGHGEGK